MNTPAERIVLACSGGRAAATAIPRLKARVADAQFQQESADCGVFQ